MATFDYLVYLDLVVYVFLHYSMLMKTDSCATKGDVWGLYIWGGNEAAEMVATENG